MQSCLAAPHQLLAQPALAARTSGGVQTRPCLRLDGEDVQRDAERSQTHSTFDKEAVETSSKEKDGEREVYDEEDGARLPCN
ncbi:hypothetical protein L209DRAFT_755095 [Thermothelomyces heterothallicus CBS 203.75]